MIKIFETSNINNKYDVNNFIRCYGNVNLDIQSEALYKKALISNKQYFFNSLSEDELYLYHVLNYKISYEYGLNLIKHIDFNNKRILDIGGSTGGLCSSINFYNNNVNTSVFDLKDICEIGKDISTNINFVSGNFLANVDIKKFYDYYDYIIFSNIFHDWNDAFCIKILKNFEFIIKKSKYIIVYEDILFDNIETLMYGLRLSANVPHGKQRSYIEICDIFKKCFKNNVNLYKVLNFNIHSALIFEVKFF